MANNDFCEQEGTFAAHITARDGECDDRDGAMGHTHCAPGTDCTDCGDCPSIAPVTWVEVWRGNDTTACGHALTVEVPWLGWRTSLVKLTINVRQRRARAPQSHRTLLVWRTSGALWRTCTVWGRTEDRTKPPALSPELCSRAFCKRTAVVCHVRARCLWCATCERAACVCHLRARCC
eukprot:525472-Prymnesium_polylepis.1